MNFNSDQIFNLFFNQGVFLAVKGALLVLLIFYIACAFLLHRQAKLMTTVIIVPVASYLRLATLLHLLFSLLLFVAAVIFVRP